jgi:arylformamidase
MDWEGQFNPRVAVPDHEAHAAARDAAAAKVRGRLRADLDVRYGPGERALVDIYRPAGDGPAPVQIYFHGGYWRANARSDFPHLTPTFTAAGAVCVLAGYDLCPAVTLADIVAQTATCLAWVYRNIARHGGDPERLYVSGSSAGAYLAAMAIARDWTADGLPADLIKGAAPVTGIYDLAPVLQISVNEQIRLTADMAARLSAGAPRHGGPVLVAVGGAEPDGWRAQSRAYAELCRSAGCAVEYLELPGLNHFTTTASIAEPTSPLAQAMLRQMRIGSSF